MPVLPDGTDGATALNLVSTIAHDGNGGVRDDFATDDLVNAWIAERFPDLPPCNPAEADELRYLRLAARSAFAAAVSPHPPSRVERRNRMSDTEAGETLTTAIEGLRAETAVTVDDRGVHRVLTTRATGQTLLKGTLALATADFLTGPLAAKLRSCQAPRCVRYFVQDHGRQQWCKTACGNRARAARFSQRRLAR
ncbi:CGNR zinc finger domain-containing protein [Salininema proteolyticum]|uniref:CGNR zinc finger domain-containing protein n=1 Tax=Salininema proteolyticum TaxID=1607685 RepID=A0ABV8TYX6_9ACTN